MTGQIDFYRYRLQDSTGKCPLLDVRIHTDRVCLSKNYVSFKLRSGSSCDVSFYVKSKLEDLGATLVRGRSVLGWKGGRPVFGKPFPSHVHVPNYQDAEKIIGALFARREMSAKNRSEIESALGELRRSARYARMRRQSITPAQKEIIESMIMPYVDTIKEEVSDSDTIKRWIILTARHFKGAYSSDPELYKEELPYILGRACHPEAPSFSLGKNKTRYGKSRCFYDCLFSVAKFYASMGDLEGALEQSGRFLPAEPIIQKTILDLFG